MAAKPIEGQQIPRIKRGASLVRTRRNGVECGRHNLWIEIPIADELMHLAALERRDAGAIVGEALRRYFKWRRRQG